MPYVIYYEIATLAYMIFITITFTPKKVTKNVSEYDFFALEKSYTEIKNEKEKMRQRFLSTISLIDEGVIFYENGARQVILSDYANKIFDGKSSLSLDEHAESIHPQDRRTYLETIQRASSRDVKYDIKYRINDGLSYVWVHEKGHYIGVDNKKSIIATVRSLDVRKFKETTYIDIDGMNDDEKMFPVLKSYVESRKPFYFIVFELTNIPKVNERYSRQVGSIMINDFVRKMKNYYQKDMNKFYRVTGIRFAMIIDDVDTMKDFKRDLENPNSDLYTTRVMVSQITEIIKPKFGVMSLSGAKNADTLDIYRYGVKLLNEACESERNNYTILGD